MHSRHLLSTNIKDSNRLGVVKYVKTFRNTLFRLLRALFKYRNELQLKLNVSYTFGHTKGWKTWWTSNDIEQQFVWRHSWKPLKSSWNIQKSYETFNDTKKLNKCFISFITSEFDLLRQKFANAIKFLVEQKQMTRLSGLVTNSSVKWMFFLRLKLIRVLNTNFMLIHCVPIPACVEFDGWEKIN